MGNSTQVAREMENFARLKWDILVASGGDSAGALVKNAIKEKTPVDTGTAKDSIAFKKEIMGKWAFKIITYAKPLTNPLSGSLSTDYTDCLEFGGPCPKGQTRIANMMFRNGSLESKEKMDQLLASFW